MAADTELIQHQESWALFTTLMKWGIIVVTTVLVVLAITIV